jgi:hypothetical protein
LHLQEEDRRKEEGMSPRPLAGLSALCPPLRTSVLLDACLVSWASEVLVK